MTVVMEVTHNDELTPPYLPHGGKRDVQVADGSLREAFGGLTLFEERKPAAGFLAGVSHLEREDCSTLRNTPAVPSPPSETKLSLILSYANVHSL